MIRSTTFLKHLLQLSLGRLVLLLVISFLFATCRLIESDKEPEIADRSFLLGEPCEAPCWYNLIPGQSTESEVNEVLAELPFVDQDYTRRWEYEGDYDGDSDFQKDMSIHFNCVEGDEVPPCGHIDLDDGIVHVISHEIFYQLTLEQVIEKLGPPDYVVYGLYPPHGDGCLVDLEWLEQGITVRIVDRPRVQLCLDIDQQIPFEPTIQVTSISYSSKQAQIPNLCEIRNCIPWPGYRP